MKRLFTFISTTVLLVAGAAQLNAQNRCVLQNDKGATGVITYSDNMKVAHQHNDQSVMLMTKTEVKPQVKGDRPTHTLNVYLPDDYTLDFVILVSDGVDIVAALDSWKKENFLSVDLEEGVYHVLANGYAELNDDFNECFWTYEDFELTQDSNVYIDFNECVYGLDWSFEDENGNPLNELEFLDVVEDVSLIWQNCVLFSFNYFTDIIAAEDVNLRFNGFSENSSLSLNVYAMAEGQKSYCFSNFIKGMHEAPVFTVAAEDLTKTTQLFTVTMGIDSCYYHTDNKTVFTQLGGWMMTAVFNERLVYYPQDPYTIVANVNKDALAGGERREVEVILLPTVYERLDPFGYEFPFIGSSLYFNENGETCWEAMPYFRDVSNPAPPSYPDYFPGTPAMKVTPADKVVNFGERTPLVTYYPLAVNADNTPLNQTILRGGIYFSGENSCERQCDYDSFIQVYVDGQEIYNDSVYKFNNCWGEFQLDPAPVVVQTTNTHLVANWAGKGNATRIDFDLNRDDAMPPTLTFLRVLNQYGDETVWLDDLSQSTLVFGCGDFAYNYVDEGGYYSNLIYDGKPDVLIRCGPNPMQMRPLSFQEDESLFHPNYGNVLVADLSGINGQFDNQWLILQILLTDGSGNTQLQTLQNLFFTGNPLSIDEYAAERLEHEVIPNPFTDEVRIKSAQPLDGVARVQLYDVLGRRVYDATENGHAVNEFIIDGSALKPGIYFYDINTEKGVMRGKIVK
ncbi:MAG: T9SS type A sorting domain-containing protein [Bacteroidales bacterium]|nr:T9SS type A sorting domain-containing protein [Bacteroidales bacterium]